MNLFASADTGGCLLSNPVSLTCSDQSLSDDSCCMQGSVCGVDRSLWQLKLKRD